MISPSAIKLADRYSQDTGGVLLLISRDKELIFESRHPKYPPSHLFRCFSITKSIAALIGARICALGLINWKQLASIHLREWQNVPYKKDIQIAHLLNLTSGLAPGAAQIYDDKVSDKALVAMELDSQYPPAEVFAYGPSGYEVFSEIIRRVLLPYSQTPLSFAKTEVLAPLGIKNSKWIVDRVGHLMLSSGLFLQAEDLLALGHSMLIKLKAKEPYYIELVNGSAVNCSYGLGFWLNNGATASQCNEVEVERILASNSQGYDWKNSCLCKNGPNDLLAMIGTTGQRVYIVPSYGLTIIRLSSGQIDLAPKKSLFNDSIFFQKLLS